MEEGNAVMCVRVFERKPTQVNTQEIEGAHDFIKFHDFTHLRFLFYLVWEHGEKEEIILVWYFHQSTSYFFKTKSSILS